MAGRIVVGWPGASTESGAAKEVAADGESTQSAVLYLASRLIIGGNLTSVNFSFSSSFFIFLWFAEIEAESKETVKVSDSIDESGVPTGGMRGSIDAIEPEDRPESARSGKSEDSEGVVPTPAKPEAATAPEDKAAAAKPKKGKKNANAPPVPEKLTAKQVKQDLENMFLAFSRSVVSFQLIITD